MNVIEEDWRYILGFIVLTFLSTWFAFGVVYYLIGLINGDITVKTIVAANC